MYTGGLGDAFGDAKQRWEGVAGISYTGNAATAEAMTATYQLLVRIANGDLTAALQAVQGSDPQMRGIGLDYLSRADQRQIETLVNSGALSPDLFQQIYGRPLNGEGWWRYARENRAAGAIFPYLGAGSGSSNGVVQNIPAGFRYTAQNLYDYNFDFTALVNAAKAWAQAHPLAPEDAPTPEAIATVNRSAPTAPDPDEPPPGWRQSTYQGQVGFYGPDGLFYRGPRPWLGGGQGVSVNPTPAPTNTSPAPASTAPGATTPTASGGPPSAPGAPPEPGTQTPLPPSNAAPQPFNEGAPVIMEDSASDPQRAGISGTAALIIGGSILAYFFFGRK